MQPNRTAWIAVFFVAFLAGNAAAADTPAKRPNILLLLTDDQRADCLGCAGHPLLKTPNIDRLAEEGVRFRNNFVTTSICCSSRASIYSGQYARRHGVIDFFQPLPPQSLATSFPVLLRQAGYRTGALGKWGIGEVKDSFDYWHAWAGQGEYFTMIDGVKVHNSEMLARHAEKFLRAGPADQPFCLIVCFKAPHDPFQPDPRDQELFKNDKIPLPRTATAANFEKLPEFLQKSLGRTRANDAIGTPEKHQEYIKQYLRLIAGVDRSVGKILGVLNDLKQTDNTVVLFTSDNGYFLGERGLVHKWIMYEESIRVPLIIRAPGKAKTAGAVRDQLALNIDLAPTILDLAGVPVPKTLDGASLRPLLDGPDVNWRTDFFYEHLYPHKDIPRTEGVRGTRWKYIRYIDTKPLFEELYDLEKDPWEEKNLAADPEHAKVLKELQGRYDQYLKELPPRPQPRKKE